VFVDFAACWKVDTVGCVVSGSCPRCGKDVAAIGTYGDRARRDVTAELIADGVPEEGRFTLEPCGDVIDVSQIRLQRLDDHVAVTLLNDESLPET
jgi:hypothetical protein